MGLWSRIAEWYTEWRAPEPSMTHDDVMNHLYPEQKTLSQEVARLSEERKDINELRTMSIDDMASDLETYCETFSGSYNQGHRCRDLFQETDTNLAKQILFYATGTRAENWSIASRKRLCAGARGDISRKDLVSIINHVRAMNNKLTMYDVVGSHIDAHKRKLEGERKWSEDDKAFYTFLNNADNKAITYIPPGDSGLEKRKLYLVPRAA